MNQLDGREARFAAVYRVILAVYWLTCAGLMIFWLARKDWYQFFQSLANACMPGLFLLLWRALRLRRTYQLEAVILAFTCLAYTLCVGACWYHLIPHYDKLMHCLSGAFTMYLALPFFYWLKAEKAFKPTDCALAAAFCLCAALAVAGLWEIAEFLINKVTGIDLQNVAATGVGDTMSDMIVCLAGALAMLFPMTAYYRRGRRGFLMEAVFAFVRNNPGLYASRAESMARASAGGAGPGL